MDKTIHEVYSAFLEWGDCLVIYNGKKAARWNGSIGDIYTYNPDDYDCDRFITQYGVFNVFV